MTELNSEGLTNLLAAVYELTAKDYRTEKEWLLNHIANKLVIKGQYEKCKKKLAYQSYLCRVQSGQRCSYCLRYCKAYYAFKKWERNLKRIDSTSLREYEEFLGHSLARKIDQMICNSKYSEWEQDGNLYAGYRKCINCKVSPEICKVSREPELIIKRRI